MSTPTAAATHPAGNTELAVMVGLNEETKHVLQLAFKVNLMALNAIILARRAGTAARGFGVLSDELRRFTRDLEQAMGELRRITWQVVSGVTLRVKRARLTEVLRRCAVGGGRGSELAAPPLARLGEQAAREGAALAAARRALREAIADADRIGLMGDVLARTAKIEAAYGQDFRDQFAAVSSEFDVAIVSIHTSLGQLGKQAAGCTA